MLSRQFKFPKVVDSGTLYRICLIKLQLIRSNLLEEIPSINTCCQHSRHKSISQSLVNMSVGDNRNKQTCNQLANKEKTSIIHFLYVKRTRNRRTYDKSQLNALTLTNTCIGTPLSWAEAIAACAQNEYTEYTHICMTNSLKVGYSSFAFALRSLFTDVCAATD